MRKSVVLITSMALALVLVSGVTTTGTERDDTLTGTNEANGRRDRLFGDEFDVAGGTDAVYGGRDDDDIYGGPGGDQLRGGYAGFASGTDHIFAVDGEPDHIYCTAETTEIVEADAVDGFEERSPYGRRHCDSVTAGE